MNMAQEMRTQAQELALQQVLRAIRNATQRGQLRFTTSDYPALVCNYLVKELRKCGFLASVHQHNFLDVSWSVKFDEEIGK